jgi:hypothetical protein
MAGGSSKPRTVRRQPGDAASSIRPYASPEVYVSLRTKVSPFAASARSSSPRAMAAVWDGATSTVWVYGHSREGDDHEDQWLSDLWRLGSG